MYCKTTLQERLKDLRVERKLNLEQLSKQTGISSSALSEYENNEYKEINHGNLITLADFYGVSVDYLICHSENRVLEGKEIRDLHMTDDVLKILTSGKINNRLLCEMIKHEKFQELLTHMEVFVDGHATDWFHMFQTIAELNRQTLLKTQSPDTYDIGNITLNAADIDDSWFYEHLTQELWYDIIRDIRIDHEHDPGSTPTNSPNQQLIQQMFEAAAKGSDPVEVSARVTATALQGNYDKMPEQDKNWLKKLLGKSKVFKQSPVGKGRKK